MNLIAHAQNFANALYVASEQTSCIFSAEALGAIAMKFTMLSIAVFVLAACTLCEADLLEGVFNLPATEFEEDDTTFPLDPTAKSGQQLLRLLVYQFISFYSLCAAVFEHEGDMTLIRIPGHESQKDERSKRNAVLLSAYRWPGGVIPYKLSSSFDGNKIPFPRLNFSGLGGWPSSRAGRRAQPNLCWSDNSLP